MWPPLSSTPPATLFPCPTCFRSDVYTISCGSGAVNFVTAASDLDLAHLPSLRSDRAGQLFLRLPRRFVAGLAGHQTCCAGRACKRQGAKRGNQAGHYLHVGVLGLEDEISDRSHCAARPTCMRLRTTRLIASTTSGAKCASAGTKLL